MVIRRLRSWVLKHPILVDLLEMPMKIYWKAAAVFGPQTTKIEPREDISCRYLVSTMEEARHFYPVYGELRQLGDLVEELEPTDVFFDIGAHVGIYSCLAARVIETGDVFAFEPLSSNVNRLEENAQLNGVDISICNIALSDSAGQATIESDGSSSGSVGSLKGKGTQTTEIEMQTGDELIRRGEVPKPDVMKIDVEGGELSVLRGLEDSLDKCRVIYCEVSTNLQAYGDSEDDLKRFLEEKGFEFEVMTRKPNHYDLKASRRSSS